MTLCVAAVADNGRSLVLVADRMFGLDYIETEGMDHKKVLPLCENWWLMFAAEDTSRLFPILDAVRLSINPSLSATAIGDCVFGALIAERNKIAEQRVLTPRAMTVETFQNDGLRRLGSELFREIGYSFADVKLGIDLIVCGFDNTGRAIILLINDEGVSRRDVPGFCAIGSGQFGATFQMFYRDLSPTMPLRQVLYYAVEAKYFGEQAGGVSDDTDLFVIRNGMQPIIVETEQLEKEVFPIVLKLSPGEVDLRTDRNVESLNKVNLGDSIEAVKLDKKKKKLYSSNKADDIID